MKIHKALLAVVLGSFLAAGLAFAADAKNDRLKEYVDLLYDQALLLEGDRPRDPVAFAKAMSQLMAEGA